MRAYRLKREECTGTGFTDLVVVDESDFNNSSAAGDTRNLLALNPGDLVLNAFLEVRINAAGSVSAKADVGVTATPDYFIAQADLLVAGTEYYAPAASVAPYVAVAATQLVFRLSVDASNGVADLSAGQWAVWWNISRKANRTLQA